MGGGVDGHAKCERHPYRATGYSVADTAQALIKLVHSSDSRNQARPALHITFKRPCGSRSTEQTTAGADRWRENRGEGLAPGTAS